MTNNLSPKSYLNKKIFENVSNVKKTKKIKDENFKILKMNEYENLINYQYKVIHLREMCSYYNLKKTGNKNELINKLYNFLKYSIFAIKIQKYMKGYFLRKYIVFGGEGYKDRTKCVNDTDFITLEPLKDIPYNQFFSFTENNNIYGCNIISMYGLVIKKHQIGGNTIEALNPYNREKISDKTISQFKKYLKLAKFNKIEFIFEEHDEPIDPKKKMEMRIIELFQYINELGNYADSSWFTNLPFHMLVMFIREIYDIWNYRAQLTPQIKSDIVPPHGNPFLGLQLHLAQNQSVDSLKKSAVRIMEYLVKSSHTPDSRSLGAYYVLAALTLVSEDARIALPWLYQSVAYN